MKKRMWLTVGILFFVFPVLCSVQFAYAEKKVPEAVVIKLEGAKMAPVNFSHPTHVEKAKVDCAVCHHKDKDVKEAQACRECHKQDGKDAFHKKCQTCHKEAAAKGVAAPTKCMECHKK